jgi:hypothetical protein
MRFARTAFATSFLIAASALPSFAQDARSGLDPNGTFVDSFGTSFSFSLCGEAGTDLCGVLTNLEGESATEENLAFVGKQVMRAAQSAPNQWKGSISSGDIRADATITMVDPNTIEIQGCQAVILCKTLAYRRT